MSRACLLFATCVAAIRNGELIERSGRGDKEFHFQNWFRKRLRSARLNFDTPGRNTYPDFCLVNFAEGFELKALAYPGREADYDCNSQVPRGEHNGRQVYYVFGRYPSRPDGNRYPVLDLVICHGSFLNADNTYVHKNRSFRGLGSYGDVLVRDRKMYVAPTPFALADGTAHRRTLILPSDEQIEGDLVEVGALARTEVDSMVATYQFDLKTNRIQATLLPNPNAGALHEFKAYRMSGDPIEPITMRDRSKVLAELARAEADEEDDT